MGWSMGEKPRGGTCIVWHYTGNTHARTHAVTQNALKIPTKSKENVATPSQACISDGHPSFRDLPSLGLYSGQNTDNTSPYCASHHQ